MLNLLAKFYKVSFVVFRWLGIETIYYNGLFYFMKRVVVTVHDAVISSMLQNNFALNRKRLPFQICMNK